MSSRTDSSGSEPGAIRSETRAFASGMRLFEAPSVDGASSPIAVTDGLAQRREASVPVPISPTPGKTP
ncbi:MAG: hypothetical protein K0Q89_1741, partial [Thermomicrobiales bacterium]|nr:hypothetical protein [Thermomicrobiales bacterium]